MSTSFRKNLTSLSMLSFVSAAALVHSPLHAATATANFNVTAMVMGSCSIESPPVGVNFGVYSSEFGASDVGAFFTTKCDSGTTYSLGLSAGTSHGASVNSRAMTSTSTGGKLNYALYRDQAYTENWDNTTSGTGHVGSGQAQSFTIYGRIPKGQNVPAANDYRDTIQLTLTY
ncbi:Csu type fimbrial protein [Comamonas sp. C24C]